jgi:SAM-dependent methyltransferase
MVTASQTDKAASRCFLCNEASDQIVWTENGLRGLRCSCGMVYTDQTNCIPVDLLKEFHPDHFYSLSAEFKARWVARHCPRGRLLEIGCGSGFFLSAIRKYGYELMGMEPNRGFDKALDGLSIPIVHECIEETSLPRHSFDVVYHCDLLAHFPDPIKSLAAMSELLRPGGVLCFEVGLLGGVSSAWYRMVGNLGLGQHLWLYSDNAFQSLMKRAGLDARHSQYFGLAPQVLGVKALGVLNRRVVGPGLEAVIDGGKERATRMTNSCVNFLRYRVGALAPHIGPQTLLVVAKPKSHGQ